ncbi:NINE protein [Gardnerella vaginalis]|uniref:TM2 domain-containing protein n=1 Tax=Gardnerella vaginalis TaxID=2702 RepID=UPI0039EFD637
MGDMDSQNGEYTESNDQTQPEYGQTEYGQDQTQPEYGQDQAQPEYGQQYDQPQYGQDQAQAQPEYGQQYAQPQYDQQYAQPQYSDPQYTQPQYNQQYVDYSQNEVVVSKRSKIVAAILAFFLGYLGVHNFYLGKTGRGVAQLLLTISVFFCWISGIWAFIEFIMILCSKPGSEYHQDGDGAELQD